MQRSEERWPGTDHDQPLARLVNALPLLDTLSVVAADDDYG